MSAFQRLQRFSRTVGASVAVLCVACLAEACSVPVFRYALDHWAPDPYRIRVLHDGELPPEQAEIVQRLRDEAKARFANVTIEEVDLSGSADQPLRERYRAAETKGRPLCVLDAPTANADEYRAVWSGPLVAATVDSILASPARETLVKSLLGGTSVVWIYLESGIAPVDDERYGVLQAELERLQGVITLPEIDPIDLKELSASPEDMKLKFETMRLARDDPQESMLVEMLLSTEPDLRDGTFLQQPMAFAVFGRGRVLYSLVGEGLSAELIEEASRFLTGACQCTVKAQNPGSELLLSVDWDGLIAPSLPSEVDVTLTGLAGFQSDRPAAETGTTVAPAAPARAPEPSAEAQATGVPTTATAVVAEPAVTADVASPSDNAPPQQPVIIRRIAEERPTVSRSAVIVMLLAVIIVVASFFLLPRR